MRVRRPVWLGGGCHWGDGGQASWAGLPSLGSSLPSCDCGLTQSDPVAVDRSADALGQAGGLSGGEGVGGGAGSRGSSLAGHVHHWCPVLGKKQRPEKSTNAH